jgi:hypothetical protein
VQQDEWRFVVEQSVRIVGRGTAVFGSASGDFDRGGAGATLHHGDALTRIENVSVEWARIEGSERRALVLYGMEPDEVPVGAVLRGWLY